MDAIDLRLWMSYFDNWLYGGMWFRTSFSEWWIIGEVKIEWAIMVFCIWIRGIGNRKNKMENDTELLDIQQQWQANVNY